ncbi:hypothetical protein [Skermanella pratensis]|uniref:hypothetical protein n=1 Tax=Skermanella pratensis TaxID=2233999 RepID=UPI0031B6005A
MFLLDTTLLTELRRPEKANRGLITWVESVVPAELFISVITVFELELGTEQAARRDSAKGKVLRTWIDSQ